MAAELPARPRSRPGSKYTRPDAWRGTLRGEFRTAGEGDQFLGTAGYVQRLSTDWSLLARSTVSWFFNGPDRAYERTRVGFAWRETDRNQWNALGRYEHKHEKDGGSLFGDGSRREAHILSLHTSYRPTGSWEFRARAAGKWLDETADEVELSSDAALLSLRITKDVAEKLDLGLIGRSLSTGGNLFGVRDRYLFEGRTTDRGLHIQLGFRFDENLFKRR